MSNLKLNPHQQQPTVVLEITLISAQSLQPPASPLRRIQAFATLTAGDPSVKLRTRVDRVGSTNPTWNDKFLLRLPSAALGEDSPSSVSVDIIADGGWLRPHSLVGSARLLLANHRLLHRAPDSPVFAAVGIRRPSGRFHGVLNVAFMVISRASKIVDEALSSSPAVSYRELMDRGGDLASAAALREVNGNKKEAAAAAMVRASSHREKEKENENEEQQISCGLGLGLVGLGLGLQRRIHLSPSDPNLNLQQFSSGKSD